MARPFILLIALFALAPAAAGAEPIVGRAMVIDANTISIARQRITLHGIDAPDEQQFCRAGGKPWRCGQNAAFALAELIGKAWVRCVAEGGGGAAGRLIAVCYLGNKDINAWMVRQGWALNAARSGGGAFGAQQEQAKRERLGLWRGEFIAPAEWRRGKRLAAAKTDAGKDAGKAPGKSRAPCLIKGNVSWSGERIYHVPGGVFYSRTRINPAKGERWFCTEAQARAAGWRRSKR